MNALHDLVATSNDAAEGYDTAAKRVHDQELGDRLAEISDEQTQVGEHSTAALSKLGKQPGPMFMAAAPCMPEALTWSRAYA